MAINSAEAVVSVGYEKESKHEVDGVKEISSSGKQKTFTGQWTRPKKFSGLACFTGRAM